MGAIARLAGIIATVVVLLADAAHAARKAFVVGNSRYEHTTSLPNPANDARDLSQRLEQLGYRVTLALDANRTELLGQFQAFARSLTLDDVALFYFAGHGVQIGGDNYLFPVDARVEREEDARTRLVPLNPILADLSRLTRNRLVILDACRNNPYAEQIAQSQAARSAGGASRGLARVYAGVGSYIAFSTQPGNVALDGDGRNSPFTRALLDNIAEPRADVHAVMRRVRASVQAATREQQLPWENSSLIEEIGFAAPGSAPVSGATAPPPPKVAMAPAPAEPTRALRSYSYVTGLDPNGDNFLALRAGTTANAARIATMGPDTLLEVVESSGPWRRVVLLDGTSGWAHSNWIKCCRQVAVPRFGAATAAATLPAPPVVNPSDESCDGLWRRRNAIWHKNGYCFTSTKGVQAFGNVGCSRDMAGAQSVMSPQDRASVESLTAREKAKGCR
jgi:uncharacterized caspase-like protein